MRLLIFFLSVFATSAHSDVDRLISVAQQAFPELPRVEQVTSLDGLCGDGAEGPGIYCPTEGMIFVLSTDDLAKDAYTLAHLYGHAAQVTYGVADIALAAIRADRGREAALRSMVTRQVECFAGSLVGRAGIEMPPLEQMFGSEPMTGSHWGRNPVRQGPRVSIGLAARAEWFGIGYTAQRPDVCTVGEMDVGLIVAADRG